jgi:hypothetical protein
LPDHHLVSQIRRGRRDKIRIAGRFVAAQSVIDVHHEEFPEARRSQEMPEHHRIHPTRHGDEMGTRGIPTLREGRRELFDR